MERGNGTKGGGKWDDRSLGTRVAEKKKEAEKQRKRQRQERERQGRNDLTII